MINAVNNDGKLIGRILDTQEKYLAQQAHASPLSYRNASPAFASSSHTELKIEGGPATNKKSSPKNSNSPFGSKIALQIVSAAALPASCIESKRE